ncbi:hypothetical protein Psi02_76590 [Planotetraspora silvatica]|uniref:Uncharacterized protein n=1 Tax=Planotetraspora silvatica TaxID=234614 RepID=A0A8J3UV16_9ACTN|nr:hypothetical protein [Planotetraspora silvatica]GII51235.1 hypothetical protein Psi02_76590 [Planotetraspora silvatica]
MTEIVAGVSVPDSPLANEATALLREAGTPLLLDHSLRSFLFGSAVPWPGEAPDSAIQPPVGLVTRL